MGIDAAWIDERQEARQAVYDPQQCLTALANSTWSRSDTVCLRFIDAYGDTVFNQAQIPVLLGELRNAEQQQTDPEIRSHLGQVCRLVEQAVDQMHTYIRFIGD